MADLQAQLAQAERAAVPLRRKVDTLTRELVRVRAQVRAPRHAPEAGPRGCADPEAGARGGTGAPRGLAGRRGVEAARTPPPPPLVLSGHAASLTPY